MLISTMDNKYYKFIYEKHIEKNMKTAKKKKTTTTKKTHNLKQKQNKTKDERILILSIEFQIST